MLGLGLGLWPRRVGAGGASLQLVDSLAFPQSNHRGNDKSYLTATGLSDPIFAAAGALLVTFQAPHRELQPPTSAAKVVHILSNSDNTAADAAGEMMLAYTVPVAEGTAPTIVFSAANGTTTVTATCTLPDRVAERFTVVVERDGAGELTMLVYSDGSAIGTVAYAASEQTLSTLTLRNNGFLLGCPSASGSLTPSLVGANAAFTGSIGFVGYYTGAVGATNTAAISAGADPLSLLTAANFRLARKPRDLTGTVPAADGATGDTLPAWTRTTASGASWRRGSDVVPARNGSGHWLSLAAIRDGTVWGVEVGETSVAVPLSGASSGLTGGVEARALYANGAVQTDWTTVATASLTGGGAWSGTVTLPLFTGGWGVIEVRAAGDTDVVFKSRTLCGVGYTMPVWGQSTVNYPMSPDLATDGDAIEVASYGNLSYALTYHGAGVVSSEIGRVTAENQIGGGFWLGAAEELARYGNTPVMILGPNASGVTIEQVVEDAETGYVWDTNVTPMISATSPLITIHHLNHETTGGYSWGSIGRQADDRLNAFIDGTAAGATSGWTIDHYLLDGEMSANAAVMFGPGFSDANNNSISTDHSLQTTEFFADTPSGDKFFVDYQARYATDINPNAGWWTVNPASLDNYSVSDHVTNRLYGARFGRRTVQGLMRAVGLDTTTNPEITGVSINGANNALTVTVNLPNGGDLQTRWGFEGTAVPSGENPVQGFEVAEFADANATRSGFTTAITDTGTGTAPNRTGTVTLTKTTGTWGPGAILYYLPYRVLAYGTTARDKELIDGLLYESGPAEGGMGIMVQPRVIKQARRVVPADDIDHTICAFEFNTVTMFQERDTVSGGTEVGIGDPIGTIVPSGTAGGYFTAPSDALRPLLKADANGSRYAEITDGKGFTYNSGPTTEAPLLPGNNTFHFGAAVQNLQDTTQGIAFTQRLADGSDAGHFLMRMNDANNAGWWTISWNGVSNALRLGGTKPQELIFPSTDLPLCFQINVASGTEATALYTPVVERETFTVSANGASQSAPFKIGINDSLPSVADGDYKLYALIVSDDTLTTAERDLARTWLMNAIGHPYPHK